MQHQIYIIFENFQKILKEQIFVTFTPHPLRAVGVLFAMVSGWAGGGKKFVQHVSQKP